MSSRLSAAWSLLVLAVPLALVTASCLEDDAKLGTEDKSGINDVPPPSGANGANGAGPGAAVGPSAVAVGAGGTLTGATTGQGGASSTGQGGAGGSGQGGAAATGTGGAGGSSSTGGAVASCALFPANFVPGPECELDVTSLSNVVDDFTVDSGEVTQVDCAGATTVAVDTVQGRLDVTVPAAPPAGCIGALGRTRQGTLRGCVAEVDLVAGAEARFGIRDLAGAADESNWGTISIVAQQAGPNVTVTAERFGPVGSDPEPVTTVLGTRPGEQLPLRVFLANVSADLTCAGVNLNGEYICVGCWTSDVHTDEALDQGSLVFETSNGTATFDNLN